MGPPETVAPSPSTTTPDPTQANSSDINSEINAKELGIPPAFEGYTFTAEDLRILGMTDAEYVLMTWEHLEGLIARNSFDELTRLPSQLRLYLAWSAEIREKFGSVTSYLLSEKLGPGFAEPLDWASSPQSQSLATLIKLPESHLILPNDWPYGTAPGIHHLVIWLKVRLPTDDGELGELTPEGRDAVEEFVRDVFEKRVGVGNVLWFKNWARSQSVKALEHFHVFVRGDASYWV